MTTEELINQNVPSVKPNQSVDDVLDVMQSSGIDMAPVVDGNRFCGFVKEDQLLNIVDSSKSLEHYPIEYSDNFIKSSEHVYNLIYNYLKFNTTMLAVLSDNGEYLGVVTQDNLRLLFKDWLCFNSQGGVLVLEIDILTYSLSEICRIIETNGAKVFSAEINEDNINKGRNYITLKLNTDELTRIVSAFERYNYKIISYFHNAQFENIDQQRLDNFLKFINI